MENKITIKIGEKDIVLNENNPEIKTIVDYVVSKRDEIDVKKIEVICDGGVKDFDSEGLKKVVIKSIEDFIKEIEVNNKIITDAKKAILDLEKTI